MKTIDACLSPDLVHLYDLNNKVAVIVDILRATSCMTTGIASGIKAIKPFASVDDCRAMKNEGYFLAGERNGVQVEDFDLGNSPFDYMQNHLQGEKVATTTTNGTVAIQKSESAHEIIIGSFLNLTAVAEYLKNQDKDVVIVCAGWKGKVNMEDSLYAGALIEALKSDFAHGCDAPLLLQSSYLNVKDHLLSVVQNSSHAKRLNRLNVHKDIEFCLKFDEYNVVPVIKNGEIVSL